MRWTCLPCVQGDHGGCRLVSHIGYGNWSWRTLWLTRWTYINVTCGCCFPTPRYVESWPK